MASRKKLADLEYNVFKKDLDVHDTHGGGMGKNDAGCLTMLAGIIVTVLVIVVIVGFMQIGKNGPAPNCAYPGCSNRLKPGSNYCWLHSKSSTGGGKRSSDTAIGSYSSGGNGSVIGGSSGTSDSSSKKNSKIWSGEGSSRKESASSPSSLGGMKQGGSSSSGGSSIGN